MKKELVSRREIESKLGSMGDFVKIDFLTKCLKNQLDFDSRRFAFLKLSELYEKRGMFLEAGRMLHNAAPINPSEAGKVSDFLGAAGFFVKGGNFDQADIIFEKALALSDGRQKESIRSKRIELYKLQADIYLAKDKRHNAMVVFEKLLDLNLNDGEKKDAQERLLKLYERLGKIREYYSLKKGMM